MAGTFSQSYAPQLVGGIFQVTSQFVGQSLLDSIRRQFPDRKTQRGEYFVDLTQNILDFHLPLIKPEDTRLITVMLERVIEKRRQLETGRDSRFQRFLKAKEYKEHAKELYIVTKRASDRGRQESLLTQIRLATGAVELNNRDPFDDPPPGRSFTDSSTDTLERVEMTTFESSTTGDAAVDLILHEQGGSTQEVLVTFSREVLANDRVDRGVQTIMVIDAEQGFPEPHETDGK